MLPAADLASLKYDLIVKSVDIDWIVVYPRIRQHDSHYDQQEHYDYVHYHYTCLHSSSALTWPKHVYIIDRFLLNLRWRPCCRQIKIHNPNSKLNKWIGNIKGHSQKGFKDKNLPVGLNAMYGLSLNEWEYNLKVREIYWTFFSSYLPLFRALPSINCWSALFTDFHIII